MNICVGGDKRARGRAVTHFGARRRCKVRTPQGSNTNRSIPAHINKPELASKTIRHLNDIDYANQVSGVAISQHGYRVFPGVAA